MQNNNSSTVYYPAGHAGAFAVGSTDPDDTRSTSFSGSSAGSNYGNHIDLVAPGNYIYGLSFRSDDDETFMLSGTSQATPLVSGVAALSGRKTEAGMFGISSICLPVQLTTRLVTRQKILKDGIHFMAMAG